MDIKDFILIGGGLLIASVVAHGFWLAWRAHRDPLRIDITPEIPRDNIDELTLLRGELPNGGARVVSDYEPEQVAFELEPPPVPVLIEPQVAEDEANFADAPLPGRKPQEPKVSGAAPARSNATQTDLAGEDPERSTFAAVGSSPTTPDESRTGAADEVAAAATEKSWPLVVKEATPAVEETPRARSEPRIEAARPKRIDDRERRRPGGAGGATVTTVATTGEFKAAQEVLVITVLARGRNRFGGTDLLQVFLDNGLKFGDMNIFHRVGSGGSGVLFSVANAVEPGTFDLSDMENLHTPGISFFLQLAGLEEPSATFDDMLFIARDVAARLGGDLKDENMSVMTGQTVEHYRQRIVDFSLKRMSKRA